MAAVPWIGGCTITAAFNVTTYFSLSNSTASTTELNRQIKLRAAGVSSKLDVYISANTIATSATTVRTRINTANGGQSVSIGAGLTGFFSDASGTDTIAAGDNFCYQFVTPNTSGSITLRACSVLFAATTNTVSQFATTDTAAFATASVDRWNGLNGGNTISANAESRSQAKIYLAGALKHLFVIVTTNARGTASTLKSRLNTANGSLTLSITAGITGQFEDSSNSDTLAVNDLICTDILTGTGGGNLVFGLIGTQFESTAYVGLVVRSGTGNTINAGATQYTSISGLGFSATEADVIKRPMVASVWSHLSVNIGANTIVAGSTLQSRINAGNGNQSISITGLTTGQFTDAVNSDSVAATDQLAGMFTGGAGGTSMTMDVVTSNFTNTPGWGSLLGQQRFRLARAA